MIQVVRRTRFRISRFFFSRIVVVASRQSSSSFYISKSTLLNISLKDFFFDIFLIPLGIIFHNLAPKIGTACLFEKVLTGQP